ncbi:MAG TPA: condensation domain-containing protein, partial [Candidatus Elarobacter sp.]|nr:condensation domain-containing protein [Candidatus Elarobacter sp.]
MNARTNRLSLLSEAERHQLLVEWNATDAAYPADRCVHELVEAQAAATPRAIAVANDGAEISYGDLNARANQLAWYLRAIGVQPEARVVLCAQRSVHMVVGLLAVHKAGGACVPLDPSEPAGRLRAVLDDSAPAVVLTHGDVPAPLAELLRGNDARAIDLHADADRWAALSHHDPERGALAPECLAYIMYAPDATGNLAGVAIEHRNLCNLATALGSRFAVDARSRVLQLASLSSGAFISDVVVALTHGATLQVPASGAVLTGAALAAAIEQHDVTHVTLPAAVLDTLPDGVELRSVRTLVLVGEAPASALVKRWAPGRSLFAAYGTAECTACATLFACDQHHDGSMPIGRPIANARTYVLDAHGEPVPIGVTGRLFVGGAGVARGYLNRPDLTAERFRSSPFVAGERLYATDERARYLPDGNVQFVDRKPNVGALPEHDADSHDAPAYEAPSDDVEAAIARIWCEMLGRERVGRNDNFFKLGGHSLLAFRMVVRVRQVLGRAVSLRAFFAASVLREFAGVVRNAPHRELPAIARADRDKPLPLSFAQRRLWFLAQMDGAAGTYHVPLGLRLCGELDRVALRRALDQLVARHEMLRTTFAVLDGEPVQRIAPEHAGFALIEHDLRGRLDAAAALDAVAAKEVGSGFDLAGGPLIRGRLIALGAREHVLLITMHHIVSDEWSLSVLIRELSALYASYRSGVDVSLPELSIQYADYAAWQREWLAGGALEEQTSYWKRTLGGAPAMLDFPTDRPRPPTHDHRGAHAALELDAELSAALKALSERHGTTLFMTLLTAWGALLSRLSGQHDLVIGTPVANRTRSEVDGLIGFFINTLALRLDYSGEPTVSEMLARVKAQSLQAQEHQELPFEHVVDAVNPSRGLTHSPLFAAMFSWHNNEQSGFALPGLDVSQIPTPYCSAIFDLTLHLAEADGKIAGALQYATALFDDTTAQRHVGYLRRVLLAMAADADQRIDRLPLLADAERRQAVVEWNATRAEYAAECCVHELVEQQAARTPDAVAVVYDDTRLTYAQLDTEANRLARYLREIGVGPGDRVALCVERSAEMIAGVLAVLKAGGAYVPL